MRRSCPTEISVRHAIAVVIGIAGMIFQAHPFFSHLRTSPIPLPVTDSRLGPFFFPGTAKLK